MEPLNSNTMTNFIDLMSCPFNYEIMKGTAQITLPCTHRVSLAAAQQLYQKPESRCILCRSVVKRFLPDPVFSAFAKGIFGLKIPAISSLIELLQCPGDKQPLFQAVTLLPCAHTVNENFATSYYGRLPIRDKVCIVCQKPVEDYTKDYQIRELAQLIMLDNPSHNIAKLATDAKTFAVKKEYCPTLYTTEEFCALMKDQKELTIPAGSKLVIYYKTSRITEAVHLSTYSDSADYSIFTPLLNPVLFSVQRFAKSFDAQGQLVATIDPWAICLNPKEHPLRLTTERLPLYISLKLLFDKMIKGHFHKAMVYPNQPLLFTDFDSVTAGLASAPEIHFQHYFYSAGRTLGGTCILEGDKLVVQRMQKTIMLTSTESWTITFKHPSQNNPKACDLGALPLEELYQENALVFPRVIFPTLFKDQATFELPAEKQLIITGLNPQLCQLLVSAEGKNKARPEMVCALMNECLFDSGLVISKLSPIHKLRPSINLKEGELTIVSSVPLKIVTRFRDVFTSPNKFFQKMIDWKQRFVTFSPLQRLTFFHPEAFPQGLSSLNDIGSYFYNYLCKFVPTGYELQLGEISIDVGSNQFSLYSKERDLMIQLLPQEKK